MKKDYQTLKMRIRLRRPLPFFLSILCNIFIFIYSAVIALCIREILNAVQDGTAIDFVTTILPWLVGMGISTLIRILAIKISAILDSILRFEAENTLRLNIFSFALSRKDIRSLSATSNKVFESLDDDVPKCVFPALLLTEVLGYCIYTSTAIVTLFVINWRVTIFIFIPLSTAILLVQLLSKKLKENRRSNRNAHEQITETIGHVTAMARIIKLTGQEDQILKHYDHLNSNRRNILRKDKLLDSITRALTDSTITVGTAIMMFMVAASMIEGKFSLGDFSIFICYLGTLADCANRIIELVTTSHQAEVSYERLTLAAMESNPNILAKPSTLRAFGKEQETKALTPSRVPLREFKAENIHYQAILSGVTISALRGKLLVICGEVGCGKSTVAGVITGLLPYDSGNMFWNDTPSSMIALASPNIAFTPQTPGIFSCSIGENLLLGLTAKEEEITQALYDAVFERDVALMEQGLDTLAGSRGDMLSGGQKQRLALARMFLRNPELCVLDDCTSALDAETEREFVIRLQERLHKNPFTCIAISNRKLLLDAADTILVMKSGQIVASGSVEDLITTNPYFHEIYQLG